MFPTSDRLNGENEKQPQIPATAGRHSLRSPRRPSFSDCLGCQVKVMEKMKNDEAVFHLFHNHGYDDEVCVLKARDENLLV